MTAHHAAHRLRLAQEKEVLRLRLASYGDAFGALLSACQAVVDAYDISELPSRGASAVAMACEALKKAREVINERQI